LAVVIATNQYQVLEGVIGTIFIYVMKLHFIVLHGFFTPWATALSFHDKPLLKRLRECLSLGFACGGHAS
jgi:hypothetical protein